MSDRPRLLFYIQHLLGIGHIKRASLVVKACVQSGMDVYVVSGGEAVPQFGFDGAQLIQLPPVKAADASFSALVDGRGQPLDDEFKRRRIETLQQALARVRPQLLVIESYPFGRRQLRWELKPLLAAARQLSPRPLVFSSVRDILQLRKPERVRETLSLIDQYFDYVLVHGDPAFIPLAKSFPAAREIDNKLRYTGYVTEAPLPGENTGSADVLVSAGGGAVGFELMKTALQARALSRLCQCRWRFLIGPNMTDDQVAQLRSLAGVGCELESIRSDFPQLLSHCRLSISQAGYNTVMDLLVADCPAVLVPFEGAGETEQLQRCRRLADYDRYALVREAELSPQRLAEAVDRAVTADRATGPVIDLDGAEQTARQLWALWQGTDHE